MKTKHLTYEERVIIERLQKTKSLRKIAKILKRSHSCISKEINRNKIREEYTAKKANHKAYYKQWRKKRNCLKVSKNEFLTKRKIYSYNNIYKNQKTSKQKARDCVSCFPLNV